MPSVLVAPIGMVAGVATGTAIGNTVGPIMPHYRRMAATVAAVTFALVNHSFCLPAKSTATQISAIGIV